MNLFYKTVFWLVVPLLFLENSHGVPLKKPVRNGKFMAFTAHDMFSDMLDDVPDPLPVEGSINEKEKDNRMNDANNSSEVQPNKTNDTKATKFPIKTEEKIAMYNENTGKFELITTTSGHFSFPLKPVTEKGVYYYGGQHYQYRRPVEVSPPGNRTEEIKIFWSSVGDAVENSPYFPIQINVPDMINAMTNFLVNYIPFINRLTNPNHPRLPYRIPDNNTRNHMDYYETYEFYPSNDNSLTKRDFRNGVKLEEKSEKAKRKTKRKSHKRKNSQKSSSRRIFQRPNFRKTTTAPVEDIKLWHQFGSDQKETLRLKNMPITRKRVRVADREVFNFKNSDISNSPIMILNVPHRPITHYKISHQEIREKEKQERNQQQIQSQIKPQSSFLPQPQQSQQQPVQQQSRQQSAVKSKSTKQRRKLKNETKAKRSSKRSGRSENQIEEVETKSKFVS